MSFNPDGNKQAQEVIFSKKLRKVFILISLLMISQLKDQWPIKI